MEYGDLSKCGSASPDPARLPTASTHLPAGVTRLLRAWSSGDRGALERLAPLVHEELRAVATAYLRRERSGHTLQTCDLIQETYLRLIDQRQVRWRNRCHFFGIAAQAMRRILVDHARSRQVAKRGGGRSRLSLDQVAEISVDSDPELVALDDALDTLAGFAPEQAQIVELRFFAGLSRTEIAKILGQSTRTVTRRWHMARAWLYQELVRAT